MKIAKIIESIISESKRVTQNMWKRMSDEEKENALLTIFDDPDDRRFEDFLFSDWNKLPGWAKRDMRTEGKLTEAPFGFTGVPFPQETPNEPFTFSSFYSSFNSVAL